MRAPYAAFAQLAYLEQHEKQLIHCCYGSSDLLMWGVGRLITDFDFEKSTFKFVETNDVLALLGGIQIDHFLDICLMVFPFNIGWL